MVNTTSQRSDEEPPAEAEANLPEVPALILSGKFPEEVTIIPRSISSLVLYTGLVKESDRQVLLPHIEITIAGLPQKEVSAEKEPDARELLSKTLTLENALWLVFDITRDIRLACARLQKLTTGSLSLETARLRHSQFFAEQLRDQAELCASVLGQLMAGAEEKLPDEA
jgi:hypothetical protein